MYASDDSDDDAEVVVPKSQRRYRMVAYILPKATQTAAMENLVVYTNISVQPLLVPVKSKWTKGSFDVLCNTVLVASEIFGSLFWCNTINDMQHMHLANFRSCEMQAVLN